MKNNHFAFFAVCSLLFTTIVQAQTSEYTPKLPAEGNPANWHVVNRLFSRTGDSVTLNSAAGDGLLYLRDHEFTNGSIELDLKGKNDPGLSFVGLAFHILNDSTFDAVYFRPFNFNNVQRKSHSVQYVSMPQFDWSRLRENFPGKYENTVNPVPDPDNWFHVKIEIHYPEIKAYVNNSTTPSLVIRSISEREKGYIGFWVGNNSEGSFKNLKLTLLK